jgi:hypothetical protein
MRRWRIIVATAALAIGLAGAAPAHAAYLEDAGWGALTVLTNAIYMPAKIVYATVGGLTGGFAFALTGGDLQTAETVWVTSMGGTYVVTPGMLQGQEPIAFTGTPAATGTTADSRNGLEEHQLGGS